MVAIMRLVPASEAVPSRPQPLTSFVGREAELDRIRQRFIAGARIVMLHGPPGAGKTRLALRHAELREASPAYVTSLQQLRAAVGERLVIVDDVSDPELAPVLVRACAAEPLVRFLVTSSEVLGVEGEHVIEVGPLAEVDARRLFTERARAIDDRFDAGSPHVAAIVKMHELPAAIERAARMLELYGPGEVTAHGHDHAPFVAGWRRLPPRAREVALACATCDEPASIATIAEIANAAVGEEVARLRRGAWLRSIDVDGARRFAMLAAVRAFVLAQFTEAERLVRAARYRPQPVVYRDRLAIGPGARYVVLPSGVRFALGRHTALRLILNMLVERRADEVTSEELLAAGWPGESVDRAAGNARVRVALSKLRALGLRDLLVRGDYGYTFADTVDVVPAE